MTQHNQYVFVSRRAIILDDGLQWVFCCSCNESRAALIASLSHNTKSSYVDLSAGECLHIAAAIQIVEKIDAVHGISPVDEFAGNDCANSVCVCVSMF